MLLGDRLPDAYSDWRVVEGDLHDIAGRVREYDPDARLVRQDGTGHLGLAVWLRNHDLIRGGAFTLAREMYDLDTDKPLTGVPDGRCLRFQRAADSRRRGIGNWRARRAASRIAREEREHQEILESYGDPSERFVHALKKDVTAKPRAYVPRAV